MLQRSAFLAMIVVAATQSFSAARERCAPVECVKALASRVAVTVIQQFEGDLAGVWKSGGSFTLYLFGDSSYFFTMSADHLPETIADRGHWTLSQGTLSLRTDTEVTWRTANDHRFLHLEDPDYSVGVLFGLDAMLERFLILVDHKRVRGTPAVWLDTVSYKRERTLTTEQGQLLKAELMASCWNPAFFAAKK